MGINLLLVNLGSPFNLGRILREVHDLGGKYSKVYVFDPRNRMIDNTQDIDVTSMERGKYELVENIDKFLKEYKSRKILTDITKDAIPYKKFKYEENDLILLGNENRGYYNEKLEMYPGIESIQHKIIVPMLGVINQLPERGSVVPKHHNKYTNISVASTAAIVLSESLYQLGYYKDFDLDIMAR